MICVTSAAARGGGLDVADSRCAFDRCQAGGIILERAPRMVTTYGLGGDVAYHPGCWAATRWRSDAFTAAVRGEVARLQVERNRLVPTDWLDVMP